MQLDQPRYSTINYNQWIVKLSLYTKQYNKYKTPHPHRSSPEKNVSAGRSTKTAGSSPPIRRERCLHQTRPQKPLLRWLRHQTFRWSLWVSWYHFYRTFYNLLSYSKVCFIISSVCCIARLVRNDIDKPCQTNTFMTILFWFRDIYHDCSAMSRLPVEKGRVNYLVKLTGHYRHG